jgi:ring-1,2-phenylacetyl-CoA epoxidase subunit PaaC
VIDNSAVFKYLLRLGDDRLVLGQRISEWCGHGPVLEEDIALSNIALDLIGQASSFLTLAGTLEAKGRTEDDLAFHRDSSQFSNLQLVEQPRGDFAETIAKLFLFSSFSLLFFKHLSASKHPEIASLAEKAGKEYQYHLRHSSEWIVRLGDGTEESHKRIQNALNHYWQFCSELFYMDEIDEKLILEGIAPDISALKIEWTSSINQVLTRATLSETPKDIFSESQQKREGRKGIHTEYLQEMLSVMQVLPRTYPDARW